MNKTVYTSLQVIIPCLNEETYISRCLQSLIDAKQPSGGLQITVVEGRSTDGTMAILDDFKNRYANIEIIDNPLRVTPISMNLGLKACQSDAFVILGGHAEIDPDFLVQGLAQLNADASHGCVGGFIENVYEDETSKIIGAAMSSRVGVGNAHFRTGTATGYVDTVAFGMYPAHMIKEIGPFDPTLVRNQDDEFNFRVTKAGFKVLLDPKIKSKYYVRGSLSKLYKQYFQYGYWKVYVNRKHKTVTSLRQLAPPLFVAFVLIGWLPSLYLKELFIGYWAVLMCYAITLLITSLRTPEMTPKSASKLRKAFMALHFGYGLGYMKGLLYFYVFRIQPKSQFESISR